MKQKLKINESAITLITLVVTIIVMLILAGVSISLAVNQGGLFAQAKNSTDKYGQYAQNNINDMNALLDILGDDNGESIDTIMELPPAPTYDSYEIKSVTDGSFNLYIYGVTPGSEDAEINFVNFNIWVDENKANKITKTATKQSNGTTFWLKINVDDLEGVVGTYNVKVDIEDTNGGSASINGISQAFTAVAELEGTEYATVSAALAKVPTDSATHTVNLLRNANCSFSSVANTDAILDLKTYTLNLKSFESVLYGNKLYVMNGNLSSNYGVIFHSYCKNLTLNSVTISGTGNGITTWDNTTTTFKDVTINDTQDFSLVPWQKDGSEIKFEGNSTLNRMHISCVAGDKHNAKIIIKDNVVSTESNFNLGSNITCNIGGHVKFNGRTSIINNGNLTIEENADITNNSANPCITNSGGTLFINDSANIDAICAMWVSGGIANINSGTIGYTGTNTVSELIGINPNGTINIKGGTISSSTGNTITVYNGGNLNISGGVISNASNGYVINNYADKSNVTKTGGTVTGTTYNCNF